jgi:glutathione S-transferase
MLELWQAEWCPYSHRVRMRLTELRVDWIARTIPLARDERHEMEAETGLRSIPTLVDGGTVIHGADAIIAHLDSHHPEQPDADRHHTQMRAEWPHWVELEGSR